MLHYTGGTIFGEGKNLLNKGSVEANGNERYTQKHFFFLKTFPGKGRL